MAPPACCAQLGPIRNQCPGAQFGCLALTFPSFSDPIDGLPRRQGCFRPLCTATPLVLLELFQQVKPLFPWHLRAAFNQVPSQANVLKNILPVWPCLSLPFELKVLFHPKSKLSPLLFVRASGNAAVPLALLELLQRGKNHSSHGARPSSRQARQRADD